MRFILLILSLVIAAPESLAQDTQRRGVRRSTPHRARRMPTRSYRSPVRSTRSYRAPSRSTRSYRTTRPTYRTPTTRRTYRGPNSAYRRTTPTYRTPSRSYRTPTRTTRTTRPTYRTPTSTRSTYRGPNGAFRNRTTPGRSTYRGPNGAFRNRTTPTRTTRNRTNTFRTPTTRNRTSAFRTRSRSVNRSGAIRNHATSRYGYRRHSTHGSRSSYRRYLSHPRHVHSHYRRHGLHLSYYFGSGYYSGCGYYYPYYSYARRSHYAFFYPRPVTYCYAPYGFYYSYSSPVYVTEKVYIRDDYAETDYEDVKVTENGPEDKGVEPEPAAGSPTTERYLRDGSKAFHEANYEEAAKQFRLAAIATPDSSGALFALGQALIALGKDDYALRVIRKAIELNAELVKEPGDIVGVYKDQKEFDRVLRALENRAEAKANEAAPILVAIQHYFTGDPRARAEFGALATAKPDDATVAAFVKAVEERFKAAEDLPPIK